DAITWPQRQGSSEYQALRERAQRLGFVLLELGYIVARSRRELIGRVGRENVRLLCLGVPRGLVRQGVKVGIDGIQIGWLQTMIHFIAPEQLIVLPDVLVDLGS